MPCNRGAGLLYCCGRGHAFSRRLIIPRGFALSVPVLPPGNHPGPAGDRCGLQLRHEGWLKIVACLIAVLCIPLKQPLAFELTANAVRQGVTQPGQLRFAWRLSMMKMHIFVCPSGVNTIKETA